MTLPQQEYQIMFLLLLLLLLLLASTIATQAQRSAMLNICLAVSIDAI